MATTIGHDSGWHRLLNELAPSPRAAAARYVELRKGLIASFRRRGLSAAEELADEAIERTVARLDAGESIESITGFAFGVARRLAFEHARAGIATQTLDDESGPHVGLAVAVDPAAPWLDSLDQVLGELPPATRDLVLRYHADDERDRDDRRTLAAQLGTGLNALRIRMHRLRCQLRASIERRVKRRADDAA